MCNDHNFGKNQECRKCNAPKPEMEELPAPEPRAKRFKPGDWICAHCGDHQYASNDTCRKCGESKTDDAEIIDASDERCVPSADALAGGKGKGKGKERPWYPGDWQCVFCGEHAYAKRKTCRTCGAPRPPTEEALLAAEQKPVAPSVHTRPTNVINWKKAPDAVDTPDAEPPRRSGDPNIPAVKWITIAADSRAVQGGMPEKMPAVFFQKGQTMFAYSAAMLRMVCQSEEAIEITHDADWQLWPEVGAELKEATGEAEGECFAVARDPDAFVVGVGCSSNWQGRERAAKLALLVAKLMEPGAEGLIRDVVHDYPDSRSFLEAIGAKVPGVNDMGPRATPSLRGSASAMQPSAVSGDPATSISLNNITIRVASAITQAGLPATAPCVFYDKAFKETYSRAHGLLLTFLNTEGLKLRFETVHDVEGKQYPEIADAIRHAGLGLDSFCLIRVLPLKRWAVGMGGGVQGREHAAKLALCLSVAQCHPSYEAMAYASTDFPELGGLLTRLASEGAAAAGGAATSWTAAALTNGGGWSGAFGQQMLAGDQEALWAQVASG
jgi:hypothetical protein